MSVFMPSMPSTGLTCRPPVSNVMPLPTSTTRGVEAVAPAGSWSSRTSRGGVAEPWPTARMPPNPSAAAGARPTRAPRGRSVAPRCAPGAPARRGSWCSTGWPPARARRAAPAPAPPPACTAAASPVPVTTAVAAGSHPATAPSLGPARRRPGGEHDRLDVGRERPDRGHLADRVHDVARAAGRSAHGRAGRRHAGVGPVADTDEHDASHRVRTGRQWNGGDRAGGAGGLVGGEQGVGVGPSASSAARAETSPSAPSPTGATRTDAVGSAGERSRRVSATEGRTVHADVRGLRMTSSWGTRRPYPQPTWWGPRTDATRPPHVVGASSAVLRCGSGQAFAVVDGLTEGTDLIRRHLDNEPAAALEGHAQHDAATFLGDLERAVARPRLHCRHG